VLREQLSRALKQASKLEFEALVKNTCSSSPQILKALRSHHLVLNLVGLDRGPYPQLVVFHLLFSSFSTPLPASCLSDCVLIGSESGLLHPVSAALDLVARRR
jgi:hypothetical protein